ncbi:spermidine synthase [Subtercola endophyticus]|uniref:spermidine synthase n=1 Tax=Subtercola endophyticus TaxID=2895559 RepID=UPI001E42E5B8|nr:spermine synthase [Subtercola endophyticus]UFS60098.1 spermine synthase [Subtercola endophyticus]
MASHLASAESRIVFTLELGDRGAGESGAAGASGASGESGERGASVATLECLDEASETYELRVDAIPQSQVSLSDPVHLEFDYVRHIGRVIDAWVPAGHPLAVAHLGAGALTLARYVATTRPEARQVVVERERALCEAMLRALPFAGLDIRYGDAREIAESGGADGWRDADVTVVDLWAGAVISARVASEEFYRAVHKRASGDAVVAVNLLDGPGFVYARGQAAALRAVFDDVAVVLDERMLGGTLLGNVLLLASTRRQAFVHIAEWFAAESAPPFVVAHDIDRWIGDTAPVTDATACDSPPPDESHFEKYWAQPFWPR